MSVEYQHIPQRPRDLLDELYTRAGAETWWNARNRMLGGRTAAQAWADGEQDVVVQVLEMLADGRSF